MANMNRREFVLMTAGAYGFHAAANGILPSAAREYLTEGLTGMTLSDASRRLQSGEVTSTHLTQACLNRIKVYNPKINAYITVMHDEALAQAAALDSEAKAGKFRSPLHGIPVALKDIIDTAGTRTTASSAVFDDRVPGEDAEVTRRLKQAGAVIIGKTNLQEFAMMGLSSASNYFGPVRNPWALDRIPGGSSGGSAAAVVSDLAFGALGTDTGGSVNIPAAYCNVVGLKPTYGLVSIRGIIPRIYSLDHCGPLTKTVEDAAMLLNVMVGYDKQDVASVEHPKEDYVAALKQPVSGLRLGIPRAPFFDHLDDEISKVTEDALGVLATLVKNIKDDVHMPSSNFFARSGLDGRSPLDGEVEAFHLQLFQREAGRYSLNVRRQLDTIQKAMNDTTTEGCAQKVVDYVLANWELIRLRKTIDDVFTDFDLVVLPTMRVLQRTINDQLEREEAPKPSEPMEVSNTGAFNTFGIPAATIPCGFSANGLPIGLLIAGPRFSEGRVLALADAYEKATKWHTMKPKLTPQMQVPPVTRLS